MPWTGKHIGWLQPSGTAVTKCGKTAQLLNFNYDLADVATMKAWVRHFRNHYCDDTKIDDLRLGYKISRRDYLNSYKFPVKKALLPSQKAGPATRSGDFSEILVSDYLEYSLEYWVPRIRYAFKVNPNTSEHGSDVIGMKIHSSNNSLLDEIFVFEVKAKLTGTKPSDRLQVAADHSDKDEVRLGETLNATRQRLQLQLKNEDADRILRFQNITDFPCVIKYGAAAVHTDSTYHASLISETDTSKNKNFSALNLIVIKGVNMMELVHHVYEKAADEA